MGKGRDNNSISPPRAPAARAHETATYIAQMSAELAALAQREKLTTLTYLLNMAAEEAREQQSSPTSPARLE
jgi:hypothetical protein